MPAVLGGLTHVGTAAMLWVGGGILVHGLARLGVGQVEHLIDRLAYPLAELPVIGPAAGWAAFAVGSSAVALVVGGVVAGAIHLIPRPGSRD